MHARAEVCIHYLVPCYEEENLLSCRKDEERYGSYWGNNFSHKKWYKSAPELEWTEKKQDGASEEKRHP